MKTSFSQLKKLPVNTQSNVYLGKVTDIIVDSENLLILKIQVRTGMFNEPLLIDQSQIIEITVTQIIVADQSVKTEQNIKLTNNPAISNPATQKTIE